MLFLPNSILGSRVDDGSERPFTSRDQASSSTRPDTFVTIKPVFKLLSNEWYKSEQAEQHIFNTEFRDFN
jgi:hypothetical protein